jgi:beta-N-acetylhexosaminidase
LRAAVAALAAFILLAVQAGALAQADPVEDVLREMTLEEKVGQMFIVTRPGSLSSAVKAVKKYHLGGYVMYATHFKKNTPKKILQGVQECQAASRIPMLFAVDEEGGIVTRVSSYKAYRKKKFPSPLNVYASGGMEAIREDAREKAKLLTSMGINLNLAPVADVPESKKNFIYSRSMGTDPVLTSEFITAVVEESNALNLGLMLKHFPGYGNNRDTHQGSVVDKRPITTFLTRDFLPFIAGAQAGVGSIMMSHNIVECMDKDYPASLSPAVHQTLRNLGFEGVIVTDGLAMKAITRKYSTREAAALAVQAGNDMLMLNDYATGIDGVLDAVKDGRITEERLDESVRRILKWKVQLGLIVQPADPM